MMDMPDLYHNLLQQLKPPAIESRLETRVMELGEQMGLNVLCRMPGIDTKSLLRELQPRNFAKYNFFYEVTGRYYEFLLDTVGLPIAVWVYRPDLSQMPIRLEKIVYFRGDETFVIFYDNKSNYLKYGVIDWTKPEKVSCVSITSAEHESEVKEAFGEYMKSQILEQRKQELLKGLQKQFRKNKKGTVVKDNFPSMNLKSRKIFKPQKII